MTEPQAGEAYYCKRVYYAKDAQSGEVTKKDSVTRFVGANFSASTTFWGKANDGSYYIKAGAPRLTRIDDLALAKENNATGTSTEVINPNWDNINSPDVLNVSLGNNGKIAVELPGTLAITKDAGVAPNKGLSTDVLNGKEFQFEIAVDGAADKTYKAEVKLEDGTVTGALFDLAFDDQGKAKHSIKDNETLYIYGLDADAANPMPEDAIEGADGLEAKTLPATEDAATGNFGDITFDRAGTFTNTYTSSYTYGTGMKLDAGKTLNGRAQTAGEFSFAIKGVDKSGSVAAADAEGKLAESDKNFSTIANAPNGVQSKMFNLLSSVKFTQADAGKTFKLKISERGAAGKTFGIGGIKDGYTYDNQVYTVELSVADNGDGILTLTTKVTDKDGNETTQTSSAADKHATYLDFVNSYEATVPTDTRLPRITCLPRS